MIPILYGLAGSLSVAPLSQNGIDKQFLICIALMLICGIVAIPAYKRLAAASAARRLANWSHPPKRKIVAAVCNAR